MDLIIVIHHVQNIYFSTVIYVMLLADSYISSIACKSAFDQVCWIKLKSYMLKNYTFYPLIITYFIIYILNYET